ncbi:hypothetical protein AAH134_04465, partial [Bacteroides thetaiotaomicron]
MTFIPFVGLCLSLMFFRQRFAPILFIIFSFYFGWFYEPQMDLLVHYEHFIIYALPIEIEILQNQQDKFNQHIIGY